MSKTINVMPISRTNYLSRVNRFGVIVTVTFKNGDSRVYDAVKYPEQYIAEILSKSAKKLYQITVSATKDAPAVPFWSLDPVPAFNWSNVFKLAA